MSHDHQEPGKRVMVAMMIPLFASLLSISSVLIATPAIAEGLDAAESDLQWILSGYALAFGMGLVPFGRAGDIWGRRHLFIAGAAVFGVTSLGAALAPDPLTLNIARVLMGIGSSIFLPQVIGMIQKFFSGSARGQAYGMMSTVIGLGVAMGPLIGGLLIELAPAAYSWRLIFLINVPVVAISLVFAVLWIPRSDDDAASRPARAPGAPRGLRRLDPVGVVLLTAAIVLIMLPFIEIRSLAGVFVSLAGLALLAAWVAWERWLRERSPDAPMVDLKLFTLPSYTWNSTVMVLYFLAIPGVWAVVPYHLQQELGVSALLAGIVTLPSALMVVLLASQVGKRVPVRGPQMLVIGSCIAVLSMLLVTAAVALLDTEYGSLWWLGLALAFNGLGQALVIPSAQTLSMQDVPEYMAGAAGGVAQTAQRVFVAVGMAATMALYFSVTAAAGGQTGVVVSMLAVSMATLGCATTSFVAARRAASAGG